MADIYSFGTWVRRRRKALDLTQVELANRVGCAESMLRKIEADARRPSRQIAEQLATALELPDVERVSFLRAARAELSVDRLSTSIPITSPLPPAPERQPLPTPATSLIGREHELARVMELLDQPGVRLLTLTGPGGIGKTRLAQQAAAELTDAFTDGICFIAMASITAPSLIIRMIAQTLGLADTGARPPEEALHAFLRKRHMLLVLDNFEQLLDAAPDIAALLASSSTLSILATSRVPLRLLGEREYPLGPLALPSEDEPHPLAVHATRDPASFGPAVQLFTDRAQAVRPDFVLTDENSAAVTAICRRLDGLPLAIELAAARVRMFSASALLARLETGGGLPLLTRGARDMPARQQTIRATLDWSYRLLPPGEQVMLARLGVFMNGFTLEAAEAVAGDTALGGLDVLIEHSLVRVIRKSDGEPRFGMLETVREYALEQLNASGEAETLKTAHMTYYLALAELAEPHLNDAEQEEWLERLEAEHDNLRAALQWSLLRHRTEQALRLSGALWRFWRMRGYHTEGRRWLEAALAVTPPRNGADRERPFPAARAKALAGACIMAHYQGDYSRATVFGGESLALSRRLGDQRGIAAALYGLALVARSGGNYTAACAMYQESLSISRELGDVAGTAFSLCRLGIVHLFATEFAAARPVLEESLALYKQLEDQEGLAIVIHCLGYTSWGEGDTTTAWRLLSEALATFRALGSRRYIAHSLSVLGRVAAGDRNAAVARPLIEEGLGLLNELGDRLEIASALDALADAAAQLGLATWAVQLMGAASVLYDALGSFERRKMYLMAYERALAAAHAQLGEQEFASAWEVGRAMTPQQAIAAQDTQQLGQSDPAQHVPAALQRPGLTELTARELDVLRLVAKGLTNAQVAEQLVVSQRTVHAHLRSIYSKLDVASRTAAARFALDHKLL